MHSRYGHNTMEAKRIVLEGMARRRNGFSPEECASHTTVRAIAAATRDIVS
jgi:hypothetical protein